MHISQSAEHVDGAYTGLRPRVLHIYQPSIWGIVPLVFSAASIPVEWNPCRSESGHDACKRVFSHEISSHLLRSREYWFGILVDLSHFGKQIRSGNTVHRCKGITYDCKLKAWCLGLSNHSQALKTRMSPEPSLSEECPSLCDDKALWFQSLSSFILILWPGDLWICITANFKQ